MLGCEYVWMSTWVSSCILASVAHVLWKVRFTPKWGLLGKPNQNKPLHIPKSVLDWHQAHASNSALSVMKPRLKMVASCSRAELTIVSFKLWASLCHFLKATACPVATQAAAWIWLAQWAFFNKKTPSLPSQGPGVCQDCRIGPKPWKWNTAQRRRENKVTSG